MLVQISFLSKTLATIWFITNKWTLPCVNTQVVEEVVPFSEKHVTSNKITLKYLHLTRSTRIFKGKHAKISCVGNLFVYLDACEVKLGTKCYEDFCIFRDYISNAFVFYLVSPNRYLSAVFSNKVHRLVYNVLSAVMMLTQSCLTGGREFVLYHLVLTVFYQIMLNVVHVNNVSIYCIIMNLLTIPFI